MFTIQNIIDQVKKVRDVAIANNIGNLGVDLQLFDDGNWKFHMRNEYQPDGTGYWSSTWIEPEDNDDECKENALALVANLNISNNDSLKETIDSLLSE